MELYRNITNDFDIIFPLVDNNNDWVTGMSGNLNSNTIEITYRQNVTWLSATFSGTVTELPNNTGYHMEILASWFTNPNIDFPIMIKIIDDAGIKRWVDQGVIISTRFETRAIKTEILEIINPGTGYAINLSANSCINLNANNGNVISAYSATNHFIEAYVQNKFAHIENNANAPLIDLQQYGTTEPVINVKHWGTGKGIVLDIDGTAIEINSSSAKGIEIISKLIGLDINSTDEAGVNIGSFNADGIYISSAVGYKDIQSKEIDLIVNNTIDIKAITDNLVIKKNTAKLNFPFFMVDSIDNKTGKTGLTIVAERLIDNGAFAACSNLATEIGNGLYMINLSATDLNGNIITLKFSAAGANTEIYTIHTVP